MSKYSSFRCPTIVAIASTNSLSNFMWGAPLSAAFSSASCNLLATRSEVSVLSFLAASSLCPSVADCANLTDTFESNLSLDAGFSRGFWSESEEVLSKVDDFMVLSERDASNLAGATARGVSSASEARLLRGGEAFSSFGFHLVDVDRVSAGPNDSANKLFFEDELEAEFTKIPFFFGVASVLMMVISLLGVETGGVFWLLSSTGVRSSSELCSTSSGITTPIPLSCAARWGSWPPNFMKSPKSEPLMENRIGGNAGAMKVE